MASRSPKKITEYALVQKTYERIHKRRAAGIVCVEVPTLGRAIDLVIYRRRILISVEFKLANWKRAIKQARDHRLVADYAYVCMPERKSITEELREKFSRAGVGLYFYSDAKSGPFKEVIPALKSNEIWLTAREKVLSYVKECGRKK